MEYQLKHYNKIPITDIDVAINAITSTKTTKEEMKLGHFTRVTLTRRHLSLIGLKRETTVSTFVTKIPTGEDTNFPKFKPLRSTFTIMTKFLTGKYTKFPEFKPLTPTQLPLTLLCNKRMYN